MNEINLFLSIIERPTAKKSYEDLRDYLRSAQRVQEADGVDFLIKQRFENVNDSSSGQK
jgi:hypothetical protein